MCLVGASQRDARLSAVRASLRASRLQRFTSSLSRALTTEAVYDVALGEGRELLGADAGLVALPVEGSAEVELVATYGFSDEETAPWRRFPLSPRTPIGEAIERGRPIFIDEGQRESLFPDVEGRARPRPRCRCGSPTRRSAHSDSASRAATSSTTTSASSR